MFSSYFMHFNDEERFNLEELANEFNVDIRTIQRDLNQSLFFFTYTKRKWKVFFRVFCTQ
ncbi:hypothetical protein DT103_04345 [Campylobacter jejuni]|nr:hypothetical protein [Campylobacter jejuni]EAH5274013.1 hypothetical protein [Campylobacter jejuni]EAH7413178.1 hypothetical protein [Campylobacter jejuni]EAJ3128955.1 hypothetical protein [Campylobacter jejuni]EAL3086432.1 hypothetical protein [Campylobacter jejuni]